MKRPGRRARSFARRAAKRAFAPLVWRETYLCLKLQWKDAQAAGAVVAEPAVPLEVRQLDRADLQRYSREAEYGISSQFLDGIAAHDDLCFGAFVGGELVSYRFFAVRPTAIDPYLRFDFPPRWVYAYKAFTHPAWRGRQLHRQLFLRSLPQVGGWLRGLQEPFGFVTLVLSDNSPSSSALMRLGFSPFKSFSVLRILSRPRLIQPAAGEGEATDFQIKLTTT